MKCPKCGEEIWFRIVPMTKDEIAKVCERKEEQI